VGGVSLQPFSSREAGPPRGVVKKGPKNELISGRAY